VFFLPGSPAVHLERYDFYIFSTLNETTYSCCKSMATMNQVERTIGRLEIELKTNEECKTKVIREIETRGQEVIDMVKNATAAMINIVNENESKEQLFYSVEYQNNHL
jgi:hypothetical protein